MLVSGRGYAQFDISVRQCGGSTATERTCWFLDSSLSMRVSLGTDHTLSIMVTIALQLGSASQALTYNSHPHLPKSSLHPPCASAPSVLLHRVTVVDTSYRSVDMSVSVVLGYTSCLQTSWRSDSSLQCRVIHDVGVALSVVCVALFY